ncbi:hypothetical protein, partial [Bradyrhizobium sp.]|uniref:hypothetical protein n=1 Tax=Bradyrhizobium sp. TaxID=376 RepID=UPI0025BF0A9C
MINPFPSDIIGRHRQDRHGGKRLYGIGCTRRQRIPVPDIEFVIPRESGISSTPRPLGSIANASGILDHPLSRMMRGGVSPHSRGAMRPRFAGNFLALSKKRAQGMPGAQCARSLAGQKKQAMPVTVTTVTPEITR